MRLTLAEARDGDPIWLLDLSFGGRVFRFASRTGVVVPTDDGRSIGYEGGIDVDVDLAFALFGNTSEFASAGFSLLFPESVSALVKQGAALDAATGELSLWLDGWTHEQRLPLLRGDVIAPSYGADGEPVTFTLREPTQREGHGLLHPLARVSDSTWPDADPAYHGRFYPLVFGRPGVRGDTATPTAITTGSPILRVVLTGSGEQWGIVSDYRVDGAGRRYNDKLEALGTTDATIRVINLTSGQADTLDVWLIKDGLGRIVSAVDLSTHANYASFSEGDDLWGRWDYRGGIVRDGAPEYWYTDSSGIPAVDIDRQWLRGAGEIIRWLLRRSDTEIDPGRWASAVHYLDGFRLDFYIDDQIHAFDFILDEIAPLLPVSVVRTAVGYAPIVWRADATTRDAVHRLTAGPEFQRVGDVQFEDNEIANDVTIAYAPRGDSGSEYLGLLTLSGEGRARFPATWDADDEVWIQGDWNPAVVSTLHARTSRSRYGRRHDKQIKASVVHDPATAALIAHLYLRRHAFHWRSVEYDASWTIGGPLELGDIVTITDPDVDFDAEVALVTELGYADVGVRVKLVLIEDPARDSRVAA